MGEGSGIQPEEHIGQPLHRFASRFVAHAIEFRRMIGERPIELEVDGGVNAATAPEVIAAGANVLVAGTAVFGEDDYARAIRALRPAADSP